MPKFDQVIPILNVSDVSAGLAFYTEVLGFEESWHWGHPPTFGGVRSGDQEIQFCEGSQGHPGTWLAIWVEDVDALCERYSASRVDIRQIPTTFEWGAREMNVRTRTATGSGSVQGRTRQLTASTSRGIEQGSSRTPFANIVRTSQAAWDTAANRAVTGAGGDRRAGRRSPRPAWHR